MLQLDCTCILCKMCRALLLMCIDFVGKHVSELVRGAKVYYSKLINYSHSTIIALCAIDLALWSGVVLIDLTYKSIGHIKFLSSYPKLTLKILLPYCTLNYIDSLSTQLYQNAAVIERFEGLQSKDLLHTYAVQKICLWESYDAHSKRKCSAYS